MDSVSSSSEPTARDLALLCIRHYEANPSTYVQGVVREALASFYSSILNAEFLAHLGYEKSASASKESRNRRNGFIHKKVCSSLGPLDILVPRDRDGSFNPVAVRKHSRAVTSTESRILTMFLRGMEESDVRYTLRQIYSYELNEERIRVITKRVLEELYDRKERGFKSAWSTILLGTIDIQAKILDTGDVEEMTIALMHGIDMEGHRFLLDMYLCPPAPIPTGLTMLRNLKDRGVENITAIVTDNIVVKERDLRLLFPNTLLFQQDVLYETADYR